MERPKDFSEKIKPPSYHGVLYPADPANLRQMISRSQADCAESRNCYIVPHRAYDYCLDLYIGAFKALARRGADIVIFIAPLHRESDDNIYLPRYETFLFPGGQISVYPPNINVAGNNIKYSNIPFDQETAFELVLPFLFYFLKDVPVLPIFCGKEIRINDFELLLRYVENKGNNPAYILSANNLTKNKFCCEELITLFGEYKRKNIEELKTNALESLKSKDIIISGLYSFSKGGSNEGGY